MADLRDKIAAALGDHYTDPATRVPDMPPMHWGGAKAVLGVIESEGAVLVTKQQLAEALHGDDPTGGGPNPVCGCEQQAAAILDHIRTEG